MHVHPRHCNISGGLSNRLKAKIFLQLLCILNYSTSTNILVVACYHLTFIIFIHHWKLWLSVFQVKDYRPAPAAFLSHRGMLLNFIPPTAGTPQLCGQPRLAWSQLKCRRDHPTLLFLSCSLLPCASSLPVLIYMVLHCKNEGSHLGPIRQKWVKSKFNSSQFPDPICQAAAQTTVVLTWGQSQEEGTRGWGLKRAGSCLAAAVPAYVGWKEPWPNSKNEVILK